jgi:hypothetical protein
MKGVVQDYNLFFAIVAAALLGYGLFSLINNAMYILNSEKTNGTIIDMYHMPGRFDYSPRVEFSPVGKNEPVVFTDYTYTVQGNRQAAVPGSQPSGEEESLIGTPVQVYYDSEDPTTAAIVDYRRLWQNTVIVLLVGSVIAAYTGWARFSSREEEY